MGKRQEGPPSEDSDLVQVAMAPSGGERKLRVVVSWGRDIKEIEMAVISNLGPLSAVSNKLHMALRSVVKTIFDELRQPSGEGKVLLD